MLTDPWLDTAARATPATLALVAARAQVLCEVLRDQEAGRRPRQSLYASVVQTEAALVRLETEMGTTVQQPEMAQQGVLWEATSD